MLRRPSPSLLVAVCALVLSLAGTAYAIKAIDGGLLKNRSVPGSKLEKNTLDGSEINESKLGKINRARRADSAARADKADHANSADVAAHATSSDSAANASKLGGIDSSGFIQGNGRIVTAHAIVSSATKTPIATVPGLGILTATWDGNRVDFFLTNATGETVDRTFSLQGGADGQAIADGQELLGLGGPTNNELDVQMAWGSAASPHFVRLALSWFLPGGNAHVLIYGLAR